ncbi:unnamed protein product, partial [Linum tenue]
MSLPASQYSVLDAERIERVDDNTFRCYVYRFKFLNFEVCPVLLVKVEEQPYGCCIKLLSCKVLSAFSSPPQLLTYKLHHLLVRDGCLSCDPKNLALVAGMSLDLNLTRTRISDEDDYLTFTASTRENSNRNERNFRILRLTFDGSIEDLSSS